MTVRMVKSETTVTLALSQPQRVDSPAYSSVFAEVMVIKYLDHEPWRIALSGPRVKKDGTASKAQGTCEFWLTGSATGAPPVWAVRLAERYAPVDVSAAANDADTLAAVLP